MPAMTPRWVAMCTSPLYRLFSRRVVPGWVLQGWSPTGHGLEIGAGGGAVAAALLTRFPDLTLTVTDDDPAMLEKARSELSAFGDRARVEPADAAALPYPDDRFDLVVSCGMLHHVGNWPDALADAVRVLRPGGRLIGYDVVDTAPVRRVHRISDSGRIALFGVPALRARLSELPVHDLRVRPGFGGALVRFTATARRASAGQATDPGDGRSGARCGGRTAGSPRPGPTGGR